MLAVLGLALSVASTLLQSANRPKPARQAPDNTPVTLDARGSRFPVVIGWRMVGPTLIWSSMPREQKIMKKIKTGLFSSTKQQVGVKYWHQGVDVLACGPINELNIIERRGKKIWSAGLTRADGDGVADNTDDGGEFSIIWGNDNQPIWTDPLNRWDYLSNFPRACLVLWNEMNNEESRQWQDRKYYIGGTYCETTLIGGVPSVIGTGLNRRINPAYAIWQILTDDWPRGANWNPDLIDLTSLTKVAERFNDAQIGVNLLLSEDATVAGILETMTRELGILYRQVGDRLAFELDVIPTGTPQALNIDKIANRPRVFPLRRKKQVSRFVGKYANADARYRQEPISIDNNAEANRRGGFVEEEEDILAVTTAADAQFVANRLAFDLFGETRQVNLKGLFDATRLLPGSVANFQGVGLARVLETSIDPNTGAASIKAGMLVNSRGQFIFSGGSAAGDINTTIPPAADLQVGVVLRNDPGIGYTVTVYRVRANPQVDTGVVWVSVNGGTYSAIGNQDQAASGGVIESAYATTAPWASSAVSTGSFRRPTDGYVGTTYGFAFEATAGGTTGATEPNWSTVTAVGQTIVDGAVTWTARADENGPVFEPLSDDHLSLPNLTGDPSAWYAGRLPMLITDGTITEAMYARQLVSIAESSRANSTAYTVGQAIAHPSATPDRRLVCTTAGTSAATTTGIEWPTTPLATVVDGTVTWTVRRLRRQARGVLKAREGTLWQAHAAGARIFVGGEPDNISDDRITPGSTVCVKVQPAGNGQTVDLSTITPVCVTA